MRMVTEIFLLNGFFVVFASHIHQLEFVGIYYIYMHIYIYIDITLVI